MNEGDMPTTVLLSDTGAATSLAAKLASGSGPVAWYACVEDLLKDRPLSSVSVLVLELPPLPRSMVLIALSRMELEYPAMQKIAVFPDPPPLPVAEYLTACGVDLYWKGRGREDTEALPAAVNRTQERIPWITATAATARG